MRQIKKVIIIYDAEDKVSHSHNRNVTCIERSCLMKLRDCKYVPTYILLCGFAEIFVIVRHDNESQSKGYQLRKEKENISEHVVCLSMVITGNVCHYHNINKTFKEGVKLCCIEVQGKRQALGLLL